MDSKKAKGIVRKAAVVFVQPRRMYEWDAIVNGVEVNRQDRSRERMAAVGTNTFRGFHRIDKNRTGPSSVFKGYFTDEKTKAQLLEKLKRAKDSGYLDTIEEGICEDLRNKFVATGNFNPEHLKPYNKLRKPVDIYIEHLVCMAKELDEVRAGLIPHLFLPLDSQMFASEEIFTLQELKDSECRLNRRSSFAAVKSKYTYSRLQDLLNAKAGQIAGFHRIYFDLIWNERYKRWGSNLFETNPQD